ncbi:GNAT family N-acetyltransferase [Spirilliplanes yamanashiensis]|uniref:N-acetyltransferase domain-containing protein n=1 Tax=Spirilliplanes yamanashiensis TaxID=42233 RepID=A0A8J3Y8R7_9ACTN|nr:GNAT family N-acetyltransferase [Spirilliplanes yamanashiensis]MDP9817049.1 GNAT superfamily N-acetyltransferase [Spirilliplanes yamanashiensis]GIJ03295.1 hypothetical protein Sya03_26470 [Spirilliplanes yamanashiensis]
MADLRVRPMTGDEFDAWREETLRAYADEQVAAGVWDAADALETARRQQAALLPDGRGTAGMRFLTATLGDGTPVGVLWLGLTHPRGTRDCAFLYDIEVRPEHRGTGLGRALLAAAEEVARAGGAGALELNVFGGNARAVRLYSSAGYTVVTQQMRKPLR